MMKSTSLLLEADFMTTFVEKRSAFYSQYIFHTKSGKL